MFVAIVIVIVILGFVGYAFVANWLYQKDEIAWFVFLNFAMFVTVIVLSMVGGEMMIRHEHVGYLKEVKINPYTGGYVAVLMVDCFEVKDGVTSAVYREFEVEISNQMFERLRSISGGKLLRVRYKSVLQGIPEAVGLEVMD